MRKNKDNGRWRTFLTALFGALLGAAACRTYAGHPGTLVVLYDHTDGSAAKCSVTEGVEQ